MTPYGYEAPATKNGRRIQPETVLKVYDIVLALNARANDQVISFEDLQEVAVLALCGTQTGIYEIEIRDANGRKITSGPIRNANLIGTAQFPVLLPAAIQVPPKQSLTINLHDLSGAQNTIQIVFISLRLTGV
jgi:hypothetical protein